MFYKKSILYLSAILLTTLSSLTAKEDYVIEHQQSALEQATALPNKGILKQKANGFVYLDISNEFIKQLDPLLQMPGELRTPPMAAKSVGAHISVFTENEGIDPAELNQTFSFTAKEIRSVTMHTRDGSKKLWMIAVDSPELESLRQKYGCTPKLKGHDFHVTLGKQMPSAPENWKNTTKLSDYNFSYEPTLGLAAEGDFVTVENPSILETAAKVDAIGQLCLKNNGFVYLDVNNDYINHIVSQLPVGHQFEPLSTKAKQMGAHISVIHEDEMIGKGIWELANAGEWFNFEVKELRNVDIKSSKGMKRLWLLAVEAPALERLRNSYNLKPKLQNHDFHITLGSESISSNYNVENMEEEEWLYAED